MIRVGSEHYENSGCRHFWRLITQQEGRIMLYVDLPTRPEFVALRDKRADGIVRVNWLEAPDEDP